MSRCTVHAERTLSEDVPAPPDAVRDFYVDLDNIKLVHPLIVSVETLSRSKTEDGYQQSYRVVDRIPLGPFTIRTAYQARLRVPVNGDVSTEADQSPGVRLRGTVRFDPASVDADKSKPATFGKYTATLGNPRVIQFSARYEF